MAAERAPARVGLIGCGDISRQYLTGLAECEGLELVACADLDAERAAEVAQRAGIDALTPDALLARSDVEAVVNLTPPAVHGRVALAAIEAGKHVYSEKPLAISLAEGRRVVAAASAAGVALGCAPDTFLGSGLQTALAAVEAGRIGTPVAASAFLASRGPESWHPDPANFYRAGAGPLFDMGPYYLTFLVALLGPLGSVSGAARISFAERIAGHETRRGERIPVETPTHVSATLEFAAGPIGTLVMSFDVHAARLPRIEIYGSEGTLSVPDPNTFGGRVELWTSERDGWQALPPRPGATGRGAGVAELLAAQREGRPPRASGALALHVLEAMHGILTSAEEGRRIALESRPARPAPLEAHAPFPLALADA